jgi:hypothetical protein
MPHSNPTIDKMEKDTFAHIKAHAKKGGKKLDRDVVKAASQKIIGNTRALVNDPTTLAQAIDHTEASLDAILDAVEAAS